MSKVIFVFPIWCFYLKYLVYSYLHFFFFKTSSCVNPLYLPHQICVYYASKMHLLKKKDILLLCDLFLAIK